MNKNLDVLAKFGRWVSVKIYIHQHKALFLTLRENNQMPVPKKIQLVPIEQSQKGEDTTHTTQAGMLTVEDDNRNLPNEDEKQDAQVIKHNPRKRR